MPLTARALPGEWLAGYARAASHRYDELLDGGGAVRAHWQPLVRELSSADDRASIRRSLELTRRLITENGVTYNVYADPQGADRPWSLDPLPLVLPAADWADIERGVVQRARLLNALLADLYGPQRLLAEGIVPPELAFGHPNFLWPCVGLIPAGGTWLNLYAADLARGPDGRWRVLADRTQAPSGAGYALENREIIEQVLPEPLREQHVRRVRGFFGELRERLVAGAQDAPLAVVLTPGRYNETYFEQAYLARRLGLALVEGADLTVRGDELFLKTLGGLRRVDAVLRRLDDDYCDPLELRSDSALGVPGLMRVVRAGRVLIANALGTGVLESSAWLGLLPAIAQRLLGESLALSSVETLWCATPRALDEVAARLEQLVVKPTWPNQRFEPVFGHRLSAAGRRQLLERLRGRPAAYVAQEHLPLSQAPVVRAGAPALVGRALSIRVYVLLGPDGAEAMPGGLARVAASGDEEVVSSQRGGGSKDVWVLSGSAEPAPRLSSPPPHAPVRHQEMPSRLAENLYWLGRYAARCENKARLLRATLAVRIEPRVHRAALARCRELDALGPATAPGECLSAATDGASGIIDDVRRLTWCASQVRSRLPGSCWQAVTELQATIAAPEEVRAALERSLLCLGAFTGFALDDMAQDEGWRLLLIGRRIERLQFLARLLAGHLAADAALAAPHLEWLLESWDSLRSYRPRYLLAPCLSPVLDLLVRDPRYPRSLGFLWAAIAADLAALGRQLPSGAEPHPDRPVPSIDDSALLVLERDDPAGGAARTALAGELSDLAASAARLSDRLSIRHFSHTRLGSRALAT